MTNDKRVVVISLIQDKLFFPFANLPLSPSLLLHTVETYKVINIKFKSDQAKDRNFSVSDYCAQEAPSKLPSHFELVDNRPRLLHYSTSTLWTSVQVSFSILGTVMIKMPLSIRAVMPKASMSSISSTSEGGTLTLRSNMPIRLSLKVRH